MYRDRTEFEISPKTTAIPMIRPQQIRGNYIWEIYGLQLVLDFYRTPCGHHKSRTLYCFDKISRKACGEGQAHAVLGLNAKRNHSICKLNLLIWNPQNKLTCKLFVRQYALTWGIKELTKDIISIVKTRLFKW